MMMNPNILNQNPLMFFDRAVSGSLPEEYRALPHYDHQTPGTEKEGG